MPISLESESASSTRRPKYVRLAEQFRDQVRAGTLVPGQQLPSFSTMQAEYGIGQATLERTYAILEEERLIVRHHGRGIFVAGTLPGATKHTLGVVAYSRFRDHPYYNHVLKGAHRESERLGLEVMLLHDNSDLSWHKLDGLLLMSGVIPPQSFAKFMPMVQVISCSGELPAVVADDYGGTRQATEYLLSLGHRRIAFLTQGRLPSKPERSGDTLSNQRVRGYVDALNAVGIEPLAAWGRILRDHWQPVFSFPEMGRLRIEEWLETDWDELGCTAILTQNDEVAVGVVEAFQSSGRRVPEDVSVVGFDGYETADFFRPRLTTIQVPLEEIGAQGTRLLIQKIRGEMASGEGDAVVKLPTALRLGDSTAVPHLLEVGA